jgi:hypothetical protein
MNWKESERKRWLPDLHTIKYTTGEIKKPTRNLRIGVPTEVRTEHLQNKIALPTQQHVLCISNSVIFRQTDCFLPASRWLICSVLFFDPGDGDDMFLRNVGLHPTDYTALYPRRQISHNHRCENLKSYTEHDTLHM